MGLTDVASVFGRYFVVGFFLPAFFTLLVLGHTLSSELLPAAYERHGEGSQVLIIGGAGLLVGLLIAGARNLVDLVFAGVWLVPRPGSPIASVVKPFTWLVLRPAEITFRKLVQARDTSTDEARRTQVAWHLDRRYPQAASLGLAPTAYGNAAKATKSYAWSRWSLDLDAVEDRIVPLMSEGERMQFDEARTDLAFFVNGTLGALAVFAAVTVDVVLDHPHSHVIWLYVLVGIAVAVLYRQAVAALDRLGMCKRAALDLHRLEMYEKLGLRLPANADDEHEIARAVNRCLLWGFPLPDEFFGPLQQGRAGEKGTALS